MIKSIMFFLLAIFFYAGNCIAFDSTFVPLDKALKSGEVVLVGFIISTSVTDRSPGKVSAHASITVEGCLKGDSCEKGKNIGIDYLAQTSMGTSLPIKLLAGTQVIVVLTRKLQESSYEFDSDVDGGTDFVFVCGAFPYSLLDEHSIFNCRDAMTGKEFKSQSLKSIKSML